MTLAFFGISGAEFPLILAAVVIIMSIGNYGRDTQLGYKGTVILCLLASPLLGFAIVYFLKARKPG
ncbi:MAG: hypothetical protein V4721_09800 [Bacteroidota bacterium]